MTPPAQKRRPPTFVPASDESDVTRYRLYWGQDSTTKLAGNDTVFDTRLVGGGNFVRSPRGQHAKA